MPQAAKLPEKMSRDRHHLWDLLVSNSVITPQREIPICPIAVITAKNQKNEESDPPKNFK